MDGIKIYSSLIKKIMTRLMCNVFLLLHLTDIYITVCVCIENLLKQLSYIIVFIKTSTLFFSRACIFRK